MKMDSLMTQVETIRKQLIGLTSQDVLGSWGMIPPFWAIRQSGMPALKFRVNARLHNGWVIIALNESTDYYEIYLQETGKKAVLLAKNVDVSQLGEVIDEAIEVGKDKEAYEDFCKEEYQRFLVGVSI